MKENTVSNVKIQQFRNMNISKNGYEDKKYIDEGEDGIWNVTEEGKIRRYDVSLLRSDAVQRFLHHADSEGLTSRSIRRDCITPISFQSIAHLTTLASKFQNLALLDRIDKVLLDLSSVSSSYLVQSLVLSAAFRLECKAELLQRVSTSFSKIKSDIEQRVKDQQLLIDILSRCDLDESEHDAELFVLQWISARGSSPTTARQILSRSLRNFLITNENKKETLEIMHAKKLVQYEGIWCTWWNSGWSNTCWNTEHIINKWPRCHAPPSRINPTAIPCNVPTIPRNLPIPTVFSPKYSITIAKPIADTAQNTTRDGRRTRLKAQFKSGLVRMKTVFKRN